MGLDVHLTMQVLGLQNGSNMGPSVGTYLSQEVFTLAGAVNGVPTKQTITLPHSSSMPVCRVEALHQ